MVDAKDLAVDGCGGGPDRLDDQAGRMLAQVRLEEPGATADAKVVRLGRDQATKHTHRNRGCRRERLVASCDRPRDHVRKAAGGLQQLHQEPRKCRVVGRIVQGL